MNFPGYCAPCRQRKKSKKVTLLLPQCWNISLPKIQPTTSRFCCLARNTNILPEAIIVDGTSTNIFFSLRRRKATMERRNLTNYLYNTTQSGGNSLVCIESTTVSTEIAVERGFPWWSNQRGAGREKPQNNSKNSCTYTDTKVNQFPGNGGWEEATNLFFLSYVAPLSGQQAKFGQLQGLKLMGTWNSFS